VQNTLIDAGPFIALFDHDDQYHLAVKSFLKSYDGRFVTSWPVITETMYMLQFNVQVQIDFLSWIQYPVFNIYSLEKDHFDRMTELMNKFKDVPMDFADASLVVIAEKLNMTDIITLDSDFSIYRINGKRKFNNLLKSILP